MNRNEELHLVCYVHFVTRQVQKLGPDQLGSLVRVGPTGIDFGPEGSTRIN